MLFRSLRIIEQAEMSDNAKQIAVKIFTILAQAESKAHNVPVEEVHFHEVGAVDSIVDVLSFAFCYILLTMIIPLQRINRRYWKRPGTWSFFGKNNML